MERTVNQYIEIDPRRCNGKPVVAGTRIPVTVILDQLADAGSVDALMDRYPEINREKVAGVLKYCHSVIDHTELELVAS